MHGRALGDRRSELGVGPKAKGFGSQVPARRGSPGAAAIGLALIMVFPNTYTRCRPASLATSPEQNFGHGDCETSL